jgi:predicted ester cyclase
MKTRNARLGMVLAILLISAIAGAGINNRKNIDMKKVENEMSVIQKNKETIRKLYEQSLNKRKLELLHEFVSEDYVGPSGVKGPAGFEIGVAVPINAFPDCKWNVEELIGEGNKVFVKWTVSGTHTGQFRNFAATGKTFKYRDGYL